MRKSLVAALATLVVAAVALSACTGTVAKGSTVRVAVSQPFSSYNAKTSFGTYQVISREPFRVRYTVRDGRKWSDGAAVDGADILLSWAANSDALNTPGFDSANYPDPDSGRYTKPFPAGVLHFDGFSGNGLPLVTKTPVIGDDGRSLTLTYDHPFVDWELVFGVGLPAHVVAERALGIEGPTRAKEALVTAIQKDDTAKPAERGCREGTALHRQCHRAQRLRRPLRSSRPAVRPLPVGNFRQSDRAQGIPEDRATTAIAPWISRGRRRCASRRAW